MEGSGRKGNEPREGKRGLVGGRVGGLVTTSLSDMERDHNASPLFSPSISFYSFSRSLSLFGASVKVGSEGLLLNRSCPCEKEYSRGESFFDEQIQTTPISFSREESIINKLNDIQGWSVLHELIKMTAPAVPLIMANPVSGAHPRKDTALQQTGLNSPSVLHERNTVYCY